jgi:hypothetical protein
MKSLLSLVVALFVSSVAFSQAPKKLAVHEWGVFRVHEDEEMANADLRALWDNLPEFVYGHIRGRLVPQHWGAVEIRDRPVLFFHASEPAHFTLKIDFPGGMPGVWWPATQIPAIYANQKQPEVSKFLQWEVSVKQPHAQWSTQNVQAKAIEKGHWLNRLRDVQADDVFVRFGPGGHYVQREKFIYYDGLFPQQRWVKFDVEKERVTLTNRVKHAVFDVTVVDARKDGKVRIGRLDKLDAGAKESSIAFTEVDLSRFASEASDTLTKQLVSAGLNDDEAKSLVDLWRKDMFETPGLHAFYRLPSEEYNRLLPLTMTPKVGEVVRVGLVFHGHLEADLPDRIAELVKQLDSDRFAVRDAAKKKLLAYGPSALVHLRKLKKTDLSTEVWKQVEALVRQWHVKKAFE